MNYLDALLVADAHRDGRAQRSALLRHRRLTKRPLGILCWQLGAEPFTAAAVAWGFGPKDMKMVAPGEPRDRELAFRALTEVAKAFNAWFESAVNRQEPPQVVLPNRGNLTLLGRLGRRLAYLPTDGDRPADPELVRFGRHLRFLAEHARRPGQQLVVVLTDLLSAHWVTGLSPLEEQNLPAIDAAVDPPEGNTAHEAARRAEQLEIGPLPGGDDDDAVDKLLSRFNAARARSTDEATVAPLRPPIEHHYLQLISRGWPLLWRCVERERTWKEAPSVERRWADDVEDFDRHIEWVVMKGGRYRTRATSKQAAMKLQEWEDAQRLVVAEEAVDDPLRMLPYLMSNQAVMGKITRLDMDNYERPNINRVRRPLVYLEVDEPFTIPLGKALYWTKMPGGAAYDVVAVSPKGSNSLVTLRHDAPSSKVARPRVGETAIFSVLTTGGGAWLTMPKSQPWTHSKPVPSAPIDGPNDAGSWE